MGFINNGRGGFAGGGFLAGSGGGGGGGGGLDLTSGGTIGGDLVVNGHLSMGAGKQLLIDPGTLALPGLAFVGDPDTGLYRIAANDPSLVAGAAAVGGFSFVNAGTLVAGTSLAAPTKARTVYSFDLAGTVTSTATPFIPDGVIDGQLVYLVHRTGGGAFSLTVSDEGTLAGSNLQTAGSTNKALGPRDVVAFVWLTAIGDWVQVSTVSDN